MAKKTLKKKVAGKQYNKANKANKAASPAAAVNKAAAPVVESAREIWLAGLGAFNVAQQEGYKVLEEGGKIFEVADSPHISLNISAEVSRKPIGSRNTLGPKGRIHTLKNAGVNIVQCRIQGLQLGQQHTHQLQICHATR